VQNIYNYFFNPFELRGSFPFAYPLPGSEKSILVSHELPKLYAVEGRFPGLLNSTPLLIFALLPFVLLILKVLRAYKNKDIRSNRYNPFDWTVVSLFAAFLAGSIPTLLLFYVGFRYETEFITGLLMLGLIGLCQAFSNFPKPSGQKLVTFLGASLLTFSVLANIALALTGVTSY
jgi:hypothetical protein